MHAEDDLDRAAEIQLVVQVADITAPVALELAQRVRDLARDAARGTEHVPEHDEEPGPGAEQAGIDQGVLIDVE